MSKVLYPASNDLLNHPDAASIKISRNCHCVVCENCSGLRPGPNVKLVRDDDSSERETALINDLVGYGSDDEDGASGSGDGELSYISACRCGHGVKEHGADESVLGEEEFARRSALAVRIDEHLEVGFSVPCHHSLAILGNLCILVENTYLLLGVLWRPSLFHVRSLTASCWLDLARSPIEACIITRLLTCCSLMDASHADIDLLCIQQTGHLLDFDYRDEDVDALRQLIKPSLTSVAASPLTEAGASPGM